MRLVYYITSIVLVFGHLRGLHAQPTPAPSLPELKIDTQMSDALVSRLDGATDRQVVEIYKEFMKHPEQYQPFALYAVAHALHKMGKKDESAFWYAVGRMRASFDVSRCADSLARAEGLAFLEQQYPELSINLKCKYKRARDSLSKALAWDRRQAYNYDHRWVNLLSKSGIYGGDLSRPRSEWQTILSNTREDIRRTLMAIEAQGESRWEQSQRASAAEGIASYEANLKRAKEANDERLTKVLERLKRSKVALEACLKE